MKPEDQIKLLREALESEIKASDDYFEGRPRAWYTREVWERSRRALEATKPGVEKPAGVGGLPYHSVACGCPTCHECAEKFNEAMYRAARPSPKDGNEWGNHKLPTNSAPDAETREARTIYTAETVPLEGVPGPNVPFFWMVCAECRHRFPPGAAHRCARPSPKDEDR